MEIYFDNAASTSLDPEVLDAMIPYLLNHYGNPSSAHYSGRKVRETIEESRAKIAQILNTSASEIYFTSGATEANNIAISGVVKTFEVKHLITSKIEHKAVLQTFGQYSQESEISVDFVNVNSTGQLNYEHLESLLYHNPETFVSLMHVNNEIGNINDIQRIGHLVRKYDGFFHSDTTQSIGKYNFNLKELEIDYLVGAAHKFHGPKGVGFIYINKYKRLQPHIYGGAQERGTRGGTENVAGIVGLAKALEIAYKDLRENSNYIKHLKSYLIQRLKNSAISGITFNGQSESDEESSYVIVNVAFPHLGRGGSLINQLDDRGIAVSGGSACSNLISSGSHVLKSLQRNLDKENVRFSLSKLSTIQEIDEVVSTIESVYFAHSESVSYSQKTNIVFA
jgi:cysteine desulfurase